MDGSQPMVTRWAEKPSRTAIAKGRAWSSRGARGARHRGSPDSRHGAAPSRLEVMTKGFALSGGGARGSFQMGAIDCLYTVFGYRPEVIAGTSVGSINAIALAQAENDDEALAQVRKLGGV